MLKNAQSRLRLSQLFDYSRGLSSLPSARDLNFNQLSLTSLSSFRSAVILLKKHGGTSAPTLKYVAR